MPNTTKTIKAVSAPRVRQPAVLRAPLTAQQKKDNQVARAENQEAIDADIGKTCFIPACNAY
jgi:hypothetical protein